MTKVFAYLRVSSQQQAKDHKDGFPRQEEVCREYARHNNLQIVNVYYEDISGTEYSRPVLAELMITLEKNGHGVKTVIIEKLDRLARGLIIQESIVADLQSKNFNLISAVEGADLLGNDYTRVAFRQMMGVFAQYNKANLVCRLRASRNHKRLKTGKCEGRKRYDESKEGKELVAQVKALRRKRNGKRRTLQEIANELNKAGKTTLNGKPWSLYRVHKILSNN